MKRIIQFYNKLEEYLLIGSLVVTVCIIFLQVIMRYVFNSSLSWSEELTRYIFIWQIWLGASIGVRERKHIKVELLLNMFKNKGKYAIDIIASVIWLAFCVFLVANGTQLTMSIMQRNVLSPALRLPMYLVFSTLPISSGIITLRLLHQIYESFVSLIKPQGGNV